MSFTRLGPGLWQWEPLMKCTSDAIRLWLALYTGRVAKTCIPGLWVGPVSMMADESKMGAVDTQNALNELITAGLFEYDVKNRVLRFTELPDAGDWPSSASILQSWWSRFENMPACAVRDAHVPTLWWMLEKGARSVPRNKSTNGGKPSPLHLEIWGDTFATVEVPVSRHRGMRPEMKATPVQTALFVDASETRQGATPTAPFGIPVEPIPTERNHAVSATLVAPEKEKEKSEVGVDSFSSFAEPSAGLPGDRDQDLPPPGRTPTKPRLVLVPPPADLAAVQALLTAIAREAGGVHKPDVEESLQGALCAIVSRLPPEITGPPEVALVGRRIARTPGIVNAVTGNPRTKLAAWLARPGAYEEALAEQRDHDADAAARSAAFAELRAKVGV